MKDEIIYENLNLYLKDSTPYREYGMNAIVVVEDSINNGRLNLVVRDSLFVYNVKRAISATGASTYINNCDFNMGDIEIEEIKVKYKSSKIENLIYPTLT